MLLKEMNKMLPIKTTSDNNNQFFYYHQSWNKSITVLKTFRIRQSTDDFSFLGKNIFVTIYVTTKIFINKGHIITF